MLYIHKLNVNEIWRQRRKRFSCQYDCANEHIIMRSPREIQMALHYQRWRAQHFKWPFQAMLLFSSGTRNDNNTIVHATKMQQKDTSFDSLSRRKCNEVKRCGGVRIFFNTHLPNLIKIDGRMNLVLRRKYFWHHKAPVLDAVTSMRIDNIFNWCFEFFLSREKLFNRIGSFVTITHCSWEKRCTFSIATSGIEQ